MSKETPGERIARLEVKVESLEEAHREWNTLIKNTIIKTVSWLLGAGVLGVTFGWHLPGEVRKWMEDWISK